MTTVIDPELHATSGHDSTSGLGHAPFGSAPRDEAACVLMTGGDLSALPGVECVLRRLEAVGSRVPVLVAMRVRVRALSLSLPLPVPLPLPVLLPLPLTLTLSRSLTVTRCWLP